MSESIAWWDFAALEGLRADDRLRVLSREASAVLFRLVLVARAGGEVPYLNHHTGAQSAAVYDLRESDTSATREACAKAIKELVDTGLVRLDDAARVIRLDLHHGVLAREAATVAVETTEARGQRRPPSWSREENAARKLRYQFAHRSGPFRGVPIPEGATWEAWSVSKEGVAFLATRNKGRNNPEQGQEQGGNNPEQPRNNPLPSDSPLLESKGNEEKGSACTAPAKHGRNKAGTTRRNNPEQGPEQPSRRVRQKRQPAADCIPLPGTPARPIYDALIGDAVLRPITVNPGDYASRVVGGMFPHLDAKDLLASVCRAAEYAAKSPGEYSDGRRFLNNWLSRDDARAAAKPKPAAAPPGAPPAPAALSGRPSPRPEDYDRPRGPVVPLSELAKYRDALKIARGEVIA